MAVYCIAYFTNGGAPRTGLSATITIYKLSDSSVIVNAAAMTEIANGGYKYFFSTYSATEEYYAIADGGAALPDSERYVYGGSIITDVQIDLDFTEIKGATWSASTDTLEHIRDKETDIKTDTAEVGIAGAGLTDLGGMSTAMKAQVNAEVLDVMNVDTHDEPVQGAPGKTISIFAKINYLYKRFRNKYTETEEEGKIYNDAGDTVDHKLTLNDDKTTFTKSKWESGP